MKIALFSDIHSNLPALEAFFAHVELHQPDSIYCLGDLVGYNVWPNEVVQEIRNRKIPTIAGNYDFGVGRNSEDCGCAYKTESEKLQGAQSIALTNQWITEENRRYLRTLPAQIRLEFEFNDEKIILLMVHGSPRKINEYLFEDRDEKSMRRILEDCNADLLFFGHTHKPYHRVFSFEKNGGELYRHAINIGSVGKPKDGDPRGAYVLISLDAETSSSNPGSIQVEFMRFDYEIEQAANAIEKSDLPKEFAERLRKAN